MPGQPVERKLAAIFAADIAGYSRLIAHDEIGTLDRLKACRVIMDGLIAAHRGHIFNTAGDSVVADFASAVDAVQCAVAVQTAVAKENASDPGDELMRFRIGVHVGDVVVDGTNLLGDGVNIAARLEALAEPGGICVSAAVRDQIGNKLPLAFADLGDGMVEEIITALSRIRWLFVIARNSSFAYKGQTVTVTLFLTAAARAGASIKFSPAGAQRWLHTKMRFCASSRAALTT